ncbi:epimerase [Sphingobium lactosutens]|uniref:NAD-dependent epimerase/dehydratase family protein n=1 Tax=Sphingobium lactosutens TaxID=522773 RepID=UPI0015BC648E|nr:NAD-dependent epimerase/dehydratase family protein [Sphingobium lactosutens]NWK98182.1 epimerase [Sphingobium lactosutens]
MIPQTDLPAIDAALAPLWPRLDGARLFFTGGTGFIGRWMLEALARAPVRVDITLLSRDPAAFAARAPHLARRFTVLRGDIRGGPAPQGDFTHIIHGATDASAALTATDPRRMFDTILDGTRAMLDLARDRQARLLFMSSGAVYGVQPWDVTHVAEDWIGAPSIRDPRSAYAEGKRAAETLCAIYAHQFGVETVTARIFALLGPLLSLDTHFAAGNFIRDAIAGRAIEVHGSGQAVRSYLYAADLAVWMWTLLIAGDKGAAYNVGSEEAVSIADLARRTAQLLGAPDVRILGRPDPGWNPGRYVPSTALIRTILGVSAAIDLDEAIRRTAASNGWTP